MQDSNNIEDVFAEHYKLRLIVEERNIIENIIVQMMSSTLFIDHFSKQLMSQV